MQTANESFQSFLPRYLQASIRALIRAEVGGRVPVRFTGMGIDVWKTFQNELDAADLVILAIQDAAQGMPIPFNPQSWWISNGDEDFPSWSELDANPSEVEKWIRDAQKNASQFRDFYLQQQAALLGIQLPEQKLLDAIPAPERHEHWLELPGTAGWVAYHLSTRPGQNLYLWENFTILCSTPEEMLFAGLVAWEMGAPPNQELPIIMTDPDLSAIIKSAHTYHQVIGLRQMHGHRDLRVLQNENKPPLWL